MRQLLKQLKIPAFIVASIFIVATVITSCHLLAHTMGDMSVHALTPFTLHIEAQNVQPCCQTENSIHQTLRDSIADITYRRIDWVQITLLLLSTWLFVVYSTRLSLDTKIRDKLWDKAGRLLILYNYLLEAFSQGILHSKLYNA